MTAAFTVTLASSSISDSTSGNGNGVSVSREIWLKSAAPFTPGQINNIALEKVHDDHPSGGDPLASKLSFAVAIGNENAEAPADLPEGVLFPTSAVRLDMVTGRPFIWAGTGVKAVAATTYTVTFPETSEIVSSLSAGDFIYLRITVGVEPDAKSTDLELSPGLQRAQPLVLGSSARSSGSSGESSGSLGPGKNVVPKDTPNTNGERRTVQIGWHPVGGGMGRILDKFGIFPRKAQHWAVFVGGYYHELGADRDMKNVYQNGKVGDEVFQVEEVGYTTFNDQAIVDAGDAAIKEMDPQYRLIDNNCQKFAINLLNRICLVGRKRLDTSYAPDQEVPGPEFKLNEETGEFEVVHRPVRVVKEKPPVTTVSTQTYESNFVVVGSVLTDENVPLTEAERKDLLDRAADLMGGL